MAPTPAPIMAPGGPPTTPPTAAPPRAPPTAGGMGSPHAANMLFIFILLVFWIANQAAMPQPTPLTREGSAAGERFEAHSSGQDYRRNFFAFAALAIE